MVKWSKKDSENISNRVEKLEFQKTKNALLKEFKEVKDFVIKELNKQSGIANKYLTEYEGISYTTKNVNKNTYKEFLSNGKNKFTATIKVGKDFNEIVEIIKE